MKKLIRDTALFIIIALAINTVFQYLLLKDREPKLFELKEILSKQNDYILFGSSVNVHKKNNWADQRSIAEMVDSLCPNINISSVWRNSASIENFYNYLSYSISQNKIPKMVVAPINLRAFSYEWNRPEYTALIAKERIFLNYGTVAYIFRKIIPQFSHEINAYSHDKFLNELIVVDGETLGTVKDYIVKDKSTIKDTTLNYQQSFLFNYMTDITPDNRKVKYLMKFDSICKTHSISTLYYFNPIDYTFGDKILSNSLSKKLRAQAEILEGFIDTNARRPLKLMLELDSSYFSYELLVNEHMQSKGKLFVAEKIAKELNSN